MTYTLTDAEFDDIRDRIKAVMGNLTKNEWIYAFIDLEELHNKLRDIKGEK